MERTHVVMTMAGVARRLIQAAVWLLMAYAVVTASTTSDDLAAPTSSWIVHLHPPIRASQLAISWSDTIASKEGRAQRREAVHAACHALVRDPQARVAAFIAAADANASLEVTPLWMVNAIVVRFPKRVAANTASNEPRSGSWVDGEALLDALRWLPGVIEIERDARAGLQLIRPSPVTSHEDDGDDNASDPQKNVRLLHAPELWKVGVQGAGVTVASIDSGVRYTHDALYNTFRGRIAASANSTDRRVQLDYAFWFAPGTDLSKETPDTADQVGHGTHTVGTAVGQLGIGIAPQATWIAARAFDLFGAVSKSDFLLATQWVVCPTKLDGSSANCSLGADVVTGSFGVDRGDVATYKQWTWLSHVLQVWRTAGTFPVFASGNTNGFQCGSVYYPASRHESVAVGALIGGSTLWGASGKGPSVEDDEPSKATVLKPDYVAPGAAIRSALSTADGAYTRLTGTSMATPHVAGALALLLSAAPHGRDIAADASVDIEASLRKTAYRQLSKPFLVPSTCGDTAYKQYPNNIYGYGLPNVCQAAVDAYGISCRSFRSSTGRRVADVVSVE